MADGFMRTAGQAAKMEAAAPEGRRQPRRVATPALRWGPLVFVPAAVVVTALLVLAFGAISSTGRGRASAATRCGTG